MSMPSIDFDGPWKEALETFLPEFLALFFPAIHAEIDWAHPYAFLDGELQRVVRDADTGTRRTDKLVQVRLRAGGDLWVLIHVEVQSQEDPGFAQRMFVYYYRLLDRYDREVVSLAVLGDETTAWRPTHFTTQRWGCRLHFSYPVLKLADWRDRQAALTATDNPFATVVLAHLAAQQTRQDPHARAQLKLALTERLYDRYGRERLLELFRFVDWLLALPPDLEEATRRAIERIEEERQVAYITSIERIGRAEGLAEGREEGLAEGRREGKREMLRRQIALRFGTLPAALEEHIVAADEPTLDTLLERVITVPTLDGLEARP